MRLMITGANGFLGSELVRRASEAGMEVRATSRNEAQGFSDIAYCRADILDPTSLMPAFKGIEAVVHAAGLAHVFDKSRATNARFALVNETGTQIVASMAAKVGVRHFILVSSVSVYGCGYDQEPRHEGSPCYPEGPYAESKRRAEDRAAEIAEHSGMSLTVLRLATLYGEGDPGNIARLMRMIDRGHFVWIGDGSNRKSLIHREDAARACITAACSPGSGIRIYNVSAPACYVRDLVQGLASSLGRQIPRFRIPAPLATGLVGVASRIAAGRGLIGTAEGALRKWLADDVYDGSRFEREFGFRPRVGLMEGLQREVTWYRRLLGA